MHSMLVMMLFKLCWSPDLPPSQVVAPFRSCVEALTYHQAMCIKPWKTAPALCCCLYMHRSWLTGLAVRGWLMS